MSAMLGAARHANAAQHTNAGATQDSHAAPVHHTNTARFINAGAREEASQDSDAAPMHHTNTARFINAGASEEASQDSDAAAEKQQQVAAAAVAVAGHDGCVVQKKPRKFVRRVKISDVRTDASALGYYWLFQLKSDIASSQGYSTLGRKMAWLDFLCRKNMGTRGLVSFHDSTTKESGCFCFLKTARTLEYINQKLGFFCNAQKLTASFSSDHPLYLEYGRRGLLCLEQKGIPDFLVDMKVADKPPPILLEGEADHHDTATEDAGQETQHRRSFACQVNIAVAVVQHPAAVAEEEEQLQAATSLAEANSRMFAMQRLLKEATTHLLQEQRENTRLKAQAKQVYMCVCVHLSKKCHSCKMK